MDTKAFHRQNSLAGSDTLATSPIKDLSKNAPRHTRSSSLTEPPSRANSIQRPTMRITPATTPYTEPRFTISGNIKTLRFEDFVEDGEKPTSNRAEAQGKIALCVGRDPILSPPEYPRSTWTRSFFKSCTGLGKLVNPSSRLKSLRKHLLSNVHVVGSTTSAAAQRVSGQATKSKEGGTSL